MTRTASRTSQKNHSKTFPQATPGCHLTVNFPKEPRVNPKHFSLPEINFRSWSANEKLHNKSHGKHRSKFLDLLRILANQQLLRVTRSKFEDFAEGQKQWLHLRFPWNSHHWQLDILNTTVLQFCDRSGRQFVARVVRCPGDFVAETAPGYTCNIHSGFTILATSEKSVAIVSKNVPAKVLSIVVAKVLSDKHSSSPKERFSPGTHNVGFIFQANNAGCWSP